MSGRSSWRSKGSKKKNYAKNRRNIKRTLMTRRRRKRKKTTNSQTKNLMKMRKVSLKERSF